MTASSMEFLDARAAAATAGNTLADAIEARADQVVAALRPIASDASIHIEIKDAVALLRTADAEADRYVLADPATPLRAYLPANNALYSAALFVFLPALYLDDVMARPSARSKAQYFALRDILGDAVPATARLVDYSQREFADLSAGAAVVFNGRPENGMRLVDVINPTVFLGFGAGPNPALIGPDCRGAVLGEAVEAVVAARLYNNGEDCLCPDLVFVHRSVRAEFVDRLVARLREVPVTGDRGVPGLINGPLAAADSVTGLAGQVACFARRELWRGDGVDTPDHHPVIVREAALSDVTADIPEYFGPVFDLVTYDRFEEVEAALSAPDRIADGMYVWGYGEPGLDGRERLGTGRVIGPTTPFEAESGHAPFGGWGRRASWVSVGGAAPAGRPLLLADELAAQR
ncbi:aldehyde dehydrogenase family protein [Tsukamurella sp. 1534]|uniref:aldehyde dehydrogenase family protein n=1 Tax=Tsukamurella sp. 1534 TaxID=1151061 RepID=UPI0006AD097C|nr:aldehyde dehydrogenase family protein [Tsukamurella sp. 1534]